MTDPIKVPKSAGASELADRAPKPEADLIFDLSRAELQGLVETWSAQSYEKPEFARAVMKAMETPLAGISRALASVSLAQTELRTTLARILPGGAGGVVRRQTDDDEDLDHDPGRAELDWDENSIADPGGEERDRIPRGADRIIDDAHRKDRGNLIEKRIREREDLAEERQKK